MNETQVTFTGWLGTDVTLRDVAGGQQVATFRVATSARRYRDGDWITTSTTWHTVKAWNRLAAHAAQSLRKSDPVLVHGRLVADVWTRADGATMTSYVVLATSVGHDMCHGTTIYTKPSEDTRPSEGEVRPVAPSPAQPTASDQVGTEPAPVGQEVDAA